LSYPGTAVLIISAAQEVNAPYQKIALHLRFQNNRS